MNNPLPEFPDLPRPRGWCLHSQRQLSTCSGTDASRPPVALGLAVLIPVGAFPLWFSRAAGFREFTRSLNPRTLTFVQSWRIAGFTLPVLYAAGMLPAGFAVPAGWGDIAIGVTAPLITLKFATSSQRRGFVFWQILGIVDLVMAIALGTLARLFSPRGVPTAVMKVLPMSLNPTFAVPLLIILRLICIAQARHWEQRQYFAAGEQVAWSI